SVIIRFQQGRGKKVPGGGLRNVLQDHPTVDVRRGSTHGLPAGNAAAFRAVDVVVAQAPPALQRYFQVVTPVSSGLQKRLVLFPLGTDQRVLLSEVGNLAPRVDVVQPMLAAQFGPVRTPGRDRVVLFVVPQLVVEVIAYVGAGDGGLEHSVV